MGAIFFYVFIYFLGYYGSNVLNMLTVRPIVTNRFIAALIPVYGVAFMHAYMIVTKPLPPGKDVTVEFALFEFVALPVVLVTMGAIYFMWNSKANPDNRAANVPTKTNADTESVTSESPATQDQQTDSPAQIIAETEVTELLEEKQKNDKTDHDLSGGGKS
ncbi:MAG: hypothetical protein A4S08_06635 [Proteobacteria bacterium SG_bin4]|nr:MAG: hypothetical protein A4S08_06635 [Proteobacteria bacterium SG_bin4]